MALISPERQREAQKTDALWRQVTRMLGLGQYEAQYSNGCFYPSDNDSFFLIVELLGILLVFDALSGKCFQVCSRVDPFFTETTSVAYIAGDPNPSVSKSSCVMFQRSWPV
jgi:hypothetical protein